MLTFKPTAKPDESLNGYLLRLAEENFLGSPKSLLRKTGFRIKACYGDEELIEISNILGLDIQQLRSIVDFPKVLGSIPAGYFLRKSSIPVCPHCLKDAGYIRQAWHHELVTACPTHQVFLLERCPDCESPLELNRAFVSTCRCGYPLTDASVAPADVANLFIAGLLTSKDHTRIIPGLDPLPQDIDAFLLFLANLRLPASQRKNAPISWARALEINQESYALAEDLPSRFRSFVVDRVEFANQQESSRFIANLGSWYRELNTGFASEVYAPVREVAYRVILERAKAPINRKMKQLGAELLGLKATYTAAEAARILRSSADRIVALVKTGQLKGTILQGASNEFCLIERVDVEAHQQAAVDLVSGKDLLKLLGTTRRVRDRLIEIGALHPVSSDLCPLFAKGDFRRSEALSLIAAMTQGIPEKTAIGSVIALDEISGKRFSNQQANELYRQIFSGEIRPVAQVPGVHGLAALRFDETEILEHLRLGSGLIELTITDLTRITRWKHETLASWIEQGFLPARSEQHDGKRRIFIALSDLIAFLSTYVVVADAAERLGSKSVWVSKPLSTVGVLAKGAHTTSTGAQRGLLFSVDALVNVASGREPGWRRQSEAPALEVCDV